jgi:acetyl esterase
METINLEIDGLYHQASLHRAIGFKVERTIVYYHGGGFIFGNKDDLPDYAIKALTSAGFDLVCMEYPKAPEMNLAQICDFVEKQLLWLLDNLEDLNLSKDYALFGRSAGGYLTLLLAKRMLDLEARKPSELIIFYGYSSFDDTEFINPNSYYNKYPKMAFNDVKLVIEDQPVFQSNLLKRYPLYIFARQSGKWLQLLGISDDIDKYTININIVEFLRVFVAASQFDKDVNFSHSLMIHKSRASNMLFISQSSEHEFDQKPSDETVDLYQKLIDWLSMYV